MYKPLGTIGQAQIACINLFQCYSVIEVQRHAFCVPSMHPILLIIQVTPIYFPAIKPQVIDPKVNWLVFGESTNGEKYTLWEKDIESVLTNASDCQRLFRGNIEVAKTIIICVSLKMPEKMVDFYQFQSLFSQVLLNQYRYGQVMSISCIIKLLLKVYH